jgi:hypothetical protein
MPKMVIEVPEQFVEVGEAMAEHLAMLQRTVDRLGGGKAVDYAAVEAALPRSAIYWGRLVRWPLMCSSQLRGVHSGGRFWWPLFVIPRAHNYWDRGYPHHRANESTWRSRPRDRQNNRNPRSAGEAVAV